MIDDLLTIAGELSRRGTGRPRQADLRRAVSTCYYALFHALARLCADELIGASRPNSPPWVRVYRALDHGFAKNALQQSGFQPESDAKSFAETFVSLQEKRHTADYDPRPLPFGRKEVQGYVLQARGAVDALRRLQADDRRVLATYVLLKSRA